MDGGGLDRGSVMHYSPGVLVGNWQEESRLREEQLKTYQLRKEFLNSGRSRSQAGGLLGSVADAARERDLIASKRLLGQTHIAATDPNGLVRFGAPMTVVSVKTGGVLAVDVSQSVAPGAGKAALTCSPVAVPQVRSTWVLEPCRDENNASYRTHVSQHDVLHYGQHVRVANETASPEGFFYLHAELDAGVYSSQHQNAMAALGASTDNVFVVSKLNYPRDAVEVVGEVVRIGDPVTLIHSATNRPLSCDGTLVKTSVYGMEYRVTCDYEKGGHFVNLRNGVAVLEENVFCFSAGGEVDGPVLRKASATVSMADTVPMACGDGVEEVLGVLRDAVLKLGGRLGFRAVARTLGIACNERRRSLLSRVQLGQLIHDKLGTDLTPIQLDAVVKRLDTSGNNMVCVQDLLTELRGDMPVARVEAVVLVFDQLMMEGEGSVEYHNMFNLYRVNAGAHPDVKDGIVPREQVVHEFEQSWPGYINTKLGTVSLTEFVEYYNDISPTIRNDARFFAMLQGCWAIPPTDDYRKGVPARVITVLHVNDTTETVRLPDTLVIDMSDRKAVESVLVRHGVRDVKDFHASYE